MCLIGAIVISYSTNLSSYYLKLFFDTELRLLGRTEQFKVPCLSKPQDTSFCSGAYQLPVGINQDWMGVGRIVSSVRARCVNSQEYFYQTDDFKSPSQRYDLLIKYQLFEVPRSCKSYVYIEAWSRKPSTRKAYIGGIALTGSKHAVESAASLHDLFSYKITILFLATFIISLLISKRENTSRDPASFFIKYSFWWISFLTISSGLLNDLIPKSFPTFLSKSSSFFSLIANGMPPIAWMVEGTFFKKINIEKRIYGLFTCLSLVLCSVPNYGILFSISLLTIALLTFGVAIRVMNLFWLSYSVALALTIGSILNITTLPGSMLSPYFMGLYLICFVVRQERYESESRRTVQSIRQSMHDILIPLRNINKNVNSNKLIREFSNEISFIEQSIEGVLPEKRFNPASIIFSSDLVEGTIRMLGISNYVIVESKNFALGLVEEKARRVITNVLLNAKESMNGVGTVEISYRPHPIGIEIEIADTGAGINSTEKTSKLTGSGLGLSSVTQIISENGGYIGFKPRLERGTCVQIILRSAPLFIFVTPLENLYRLMPSGLIKQYSFKSQTWYQSLITPNLRSVVLYEDIAPTLNMDVRLIQIADLDFINPIQISKATLIEDDKYIARLWERSANMHAIKLDVISGIDSIKVDNEIIFADRFIGEVDLSSRLVEFLEKDATVFSISQTVSSTSKIPAWENPCTYLKLRLRKSDG